MRLRVASAPGSLRTVEDDEEMRDEASVAAIGRRAHIDSARKSKALKKACAAGLATAGSCPGGPRPFAYRWVGPHLEKRLVQVSEKVPVVERIFRDYVAGMSQMAIAKALNADHVPTVKGAEWCQAVGPARASEPAPSEALWHQAAALQEATARTKGGGGGAGRRNRTCSPRGFLRCGSCGHAMLPRTDPIRRDGHYEVYICDGRRRNGPDFCSQLPVERAPLDDALLSDLTRRYVDMDGTRERIARRFAADRARVADTLVQAECGGQRRPRSLRAGPARVPGRCDRGAPSARRRRLRSLASRSTIGSWPRPLRCSTRGPSCCATWPTSAPHPQARLDRAHQHHRIPAVPRP